MDNYGAGVSRVLLTDATQYTHTIWQQGTPPTDADLNLQQTLAIDLVRNTVLRGLPSGFLGDALNPERDFVTNPAWSNYFQFGLQVPGERYPVIWANVNGYLVPVAGTRTRTRVAPGAPNNDDFSNVVALDPPPSDGTRVDFVYLEVWRVRIKPNDINFKPADFAIWTYGNVEGGFDVLADDMIDAALGFETNQRVQTQYRICVAKGLGGLTASPDGFDGVFAQGPAAAPTGFTYSNMRVELGDPGLWRAGDGTENELGTVDGYVYAVPIAAVFRRNSAAWNGNPTADNLNGAFNRNPSALDRAGIRAFVPSGTLNTAVTSSQLTLPLVASADLPLPPNPGVLNAVLIRVGDELMTYSSITNGVVQLVARGVSGTLPEAHPAGATVALEAGRPDGLFADQVASTDILDLRHIVSPNGFDCQGLLERNLDKLLRGQLRSSWRRNLAGNQGPFIHYQDAIVKGVSSTGEKLDAPDGIRMVFSDAATLQPVECIVAPAPTKNPVAVRIDDQAFSLAIAATTKNAVVGGTFSAGDVLTLDVAQLRAGVQATDQIRWLTEGVTLRYEGETSAIDPSLYTVTHADPVTKLGDLLITLNANFPPRPASTTRLLHIRAFVLYGPGRGLSRRPDALHSVSFFGPQSIVYRSGGTPDQNSPAHVSWAPLWSKYCSKPLAGCLPSTSDVYADLGSKTVVVTPFRRVDFPTLMTMDGTAANLVATAKATGSQGAANGGSNTFTRGTEVLAAGQTVAIGDALVIPSGVGAGRYVITGLTTTTFTLDRALILATAANTTGLKYTVNAAQGLMPLKKADGVTAKYERVDPLGLFCSQSTLNSATSSIYVSLPRHLVPGWGEVHAPIVTKNQPSFGSGVNFMVRCDNGVSPPQSQAAFAAFSGQGGQQYSIFSTEKAIGYNAVITRQGSKVCGIRMFTDTRGLARQGLELPPFYGIARLMGVYKLSDYSVAGGAFNDDRTTRTSGGAVNLLRQSLGPDDGPVMWIEIDDDRDSTFVINARALDLSKAGVSKLADTDYIVEAVIFGFDRGSFDLSSEFRLLLTRPGSGAVWSSIIGGNVSTSDRLANVNKPVSGLSAVLPGPAGDKEQILINYSRTVYQGDPWATQSPDRLDLVYNPGPVSASSRYLLASVPATPSRKWEKPVEVLAAMTFTTSLGTGRYSGEGPTGPFDFRSVGLADATAAAPTSVTDQRPAYLADHAPVDLVNIGSEYLGCTERLPLGAGFRDSSFRGQGFNRRGVALVYSNSAACGPVTGVALGSGTEHVQVLLGDATTGVGAPGDILVHVDGDPSEAPLPLSYRVLRGGAVYLGNGPRPGGAVSFSAEPIEPMTKTDQISPGTPVTPSVSVLHGRALLVRNAVTNGSNSDRFDRSTGDELMMLIITGAQVSTDSAAARGAVVIGANGEGEGAAAADLYRIGGHPLVRGGAKVQLDVGSIPLSRNPASVK